MLLYIHNCVKTEKRSRNVKNSVFFRREETGIGDLGGGEGLGSPFSPPQGRPGFQG